MTTDAPAIAIPQPGDKLGWLPQYPHDPAAPFTSGRDLDPRNWSLSDFMRADAPILEERFYDFPGPYYNQGRTGTCTIHGSKHATMCDPQRAWLVDSAPTRWEAYDYACAHDGWAGNDLNIDPTRQNGTYTNAIADSMRHFGIWDAWAYAKSMDDILRWLSNHGPMCLAHDWEDKFFSPDDEGFISIGAGNYQSGHYYAIRGFTKRHRTPYARAINSWGTTWGDAGEFNVPLDLVEYLIFGRRGEAVTFVERPVVPPAPPDPEPEVPPVPDPNVFQYPYREVLTIEEARAKGYLTQEAAARNTHLVYVDCVRVDRKGVRPDSPPEGGLASWPLDHFIAEGHLDDGTLDDPMRVFMVRRIEAHHRADWNQP